MQANLLASLDNINLDDYFVDFDKQEEKSEVNNVCRNCKSSHIIEDFTQGIMVCTNCGQVNDNVMDYNPEWRQYDDDAKTEGRCGMPINKLLPQSSLGTTISGYGKNRLKILHTWNQMPYRERSLNEVFKMVHSVCEKNKIIKCIEDDAKIMYKTVSDCKHITGSNSGKFIITRGKNRLGIIAACVFYACKRKNMTRTPKEIANMFNLKHAEMSKGCKNFIKLLNIRKFSMATSVGQLDQFVRRYCTELNMKQEYMNISLQIAHNIERLNVASEHTPVSLAATVLLIMGELYGIGSMTKKRLGTKFGVSDVTMSKAYKKLENLKHVLNNDESVDKILVKMKEERSKIALSPEILERMKKFGVNTASKDEYDTNDIDFDDDSLEGKSINDVLEEIKKCKIEDMDRLIELSEYCEQQIEEQ